jgi:hypothetical protein
LRSHVSTAFIRTARPRARSVSLTDRGLVVRIDLAAGGDDAPCRRQRPQNVTGSCSNADASWATMPVSGRLGKFSSAAGGGGSTHLHPFDRSYRPDVSPAHPKSAAVDAVIKALADGETPERPVMRDAVRELLRELSLKAPGRSVEVRVPPFGAVQCIPGPRHTRGTPPNVVEMDALTWVKVATGTITWAAAVESGVIRSSGVRADLSPFLPLSAGS